MGLGDLFCKEEPLTRGLDGPVGENLMVVVATFDGVSALIFERGLGLSWAL